MSQKNGTNGAHGGNGAHGWSDNAYSGANRPALIIRGQECILELLRYVENHIATLRQAETASNGADAALAQLHEARFNIRARIRRAGTLLQELDWEI